PHQLVSAFRATLEEVVESDLILHVIDISDPDRLAKKQVVLDVLKEIGAGDHALLTVYNKADLLENRNQRSETGMSRDPEFHGWIPDGLVVSAVTGEGLDRLVEEIVNHVSPIRV